MKKDLHSFWLLIFILTPFFSHLTAQDNLKVEFEDPADVPDFLNICGDPDTEIVKVSVDGLAPEERTNIFATAHLFKGVEFISFDMANSSAGVSLFDGSDPANPVFQLPPLGPLGTVEVYVAFSVAANCEYTDTLTTNNAAEVFDVWEFDYDMGTSTGLNELDNNIEYRDAFAIPSFTLAVQNIFGPARVGDCFSRDIIATNSGLDGFVDTIFYTNKQGAGVYVENIEVNGTLISVNKQLDINGDTIITAVIDGTYFIDNTIGPVNPGNGDVFFDPNETVTITENICVLDCYENRASIHSIDWGCGGRSCTTTTINDFVSIGQGAANLIFANTGTLTNDYSGYCNTGISTVTFTNDGVEIDAGFATMIDVATGIGIGSGFGLTDNGYQITGIRIAGIDISTVSSLVDLEGNSQFTSDPDGAGGLTDFDGDGFFDDLPLNESIEISVFYEFDCSQAQDPGIDNSCPNDFSTSFAARIDHTDQCGERIVRLETNYFRPANSRSEVENFTDPDAFVLSDTFYIKHTQTRSVRFFEKECSGNEYFQVQVVLPSGINIIASETELLRNVATSFPLVNSSLINDTLTLIFDASVTPFLNGDYTLQLAFQAECFADLGLTYFPTELSFVCPDCACQHLWFCGDLEGPMLHSSNPPCPDIICPIGLRTMDFAVNRTTFGYADNTYSTPIDPSSANTKVAISCDSVEMQITNIVGSTPVIDSIGMMITYNNIDGSLDNTETFLFGKGAVRITNGGNEYFCSVDPSALTVQIVDSTKILDFDLNSCLTGLGIILVAGDTVEFTGQFSVNPEGPYPVQFKKVPNLRGWGYARFNDTNESCDNFGDVFTLAKNRTVFDFPNSNNFPDGCAESFLRYRLITVNNGFTNWFGNEYRQAIGIDSLSFTFDTAIFEAFNIFQPEVSIPNHPIHGDNFFPMPPFSDFPDGNYKVRFDTLTIVPSLNSVLSYSFNFRIRVLPNCQSLNGSSFEDNRFKFEPKIYYQDRYYAREIGDGTCAESVADSLDNDIFYTDPPSFSFTAVTNPNYMLTGDTAVWVVQHCNTSFTADATLTWIALEDIEGVIEAVSIEDISDPGNIIELPFTAYGSAGNNYYAYTPALSRADGMASIEEICNTIRVKAIITRCGFTPFNIRAGWNCGPYIEAPWNPELYPPCNDLQIPLSVTTLDPFLDANIVEQPATNPDICDTSTIAILVRNTNLGSAYDVKTQIILPLTGASLVPGSVEIAYPSSAPYTSATGDPTFVGVNSKGRIFQYDDFSLLHPFLDQWGLPGFSPAEPFDSNEYRIRYQFVTDCDFQSGALTHYTLQGLKGCGDSTNYETGETLPLHINGANPGVSKILDIHFADDATLLPGSSSTIEITAVNLTTTPTDTVDKILLRLPLDINYEPGSTIAIDPPTWTITEPEIDTVLNYQNLYWCLPAGLVQNDSVTMTLNLNAPDYDCSVLGLEIGLFTVFRQTLTCASSGTDCEVESFTSSNNGQMTILPVSQNVLRFDFNSITSTCETGNQEMITLNGQFINNGVDFPGVPFTVRYYHDVDGNGMFDTGEPEIGNFVENGPILHNDSLLFVHDVTVDFNQVCSIVGLIDTTGLDLCSDGQVSLAEPQLLNAGDDQIHCSLVPTIIVTNLGDPNCNSLVSYTYNWLAIAPASTSDLSATNIPDPILTVPHSGMTQDTLRYILETIRPGCTAITKDTVSVVRGLAVTADLGPTIYLLNGGSTILSPTVGGAIGPYTYEWSPPAALSDINAQSPTATPIQDTTIYTVTVTSPVGCSVIDNVTVIIGNAITANAYPSDSTICEGSTIQLNATGGTDYLWVPDSGNPPGGALSAANIPNPIFSNGLAGSTYVYDVYVQDAAFPGFEDTATVTVEVLPLPTIGILASPGTFICESQEVVLTGTGADSYIWRNPATGTMIGIGASLTIEPSVTSSYEVTGTDSLGCSSSQIITITVDEINAVANASANIVCEGDSILLTGGTGDLLEWFINGSSIGTGDSLTVLPDSTTTYTLTVQNLSGCVDSANVSVTVESLPIAFTPINDFEACGDSVFSIAIQMSQPIQNFFITGNGTFSNDQIIGNVLTFDANFSGDTTNFIVTLEGNSSLCTITESFSIFPCACIPPTVNSLAIIEATCGNSDGSATIHLQEDDGAYSYTWTPDLGTVQGLGNSRSNLPFGAYTVEITDTNTINCSTQTFLLITNSDGPEATATTTPATCLLADGTATLDPPGYIYLWQDSVVANTRTDLSEGTYFITLTDPADPDCPNVMAVEIGSESPLEATLEVNDYPDCGIANGTVTLNVSNGSGDYAYSWSDGLVSEDSIRPNLASGTYLVTITDTDSSGCELAFIFTLTDSVGTAVLTVLDTFDLSCHGAMDGAVDFTVNYDSAFVQPADTFITDGNLLYENGNLPAGDYCIYVRDANNCLVSASCFTIAEPDPMILQFVIVPDCENGGSINVEVTGGSPPFIYDWADIPGNDDPVDRVGLGAGIYELAVTDSLNCMVFDDLIRVPTCADSCEYFGGLDTIFMELENCDLTTELCFNSPLENILNYEITDNGMPYSGSLAGCDFDSLIAYDYSEIFGAGALGPYNVTEWNVNGTIFTGEFQDIPALIDSMNVWDPGGNWRLASVGQYIIGGGPGASYGQLIVEAIDFGTTSTVGFNFLWTPNGYLIELDTGFHEVIITDTITGCSDTLIAIISCVNTDNICINEEKEICVNSSDLMLSGPVTSMGNICPEGLDPSVNFELDFDNLCIRYTGLKVGIDTACIQFCDDFGICDTVNLNITVDSCLLSTTDYIKDTIFINQTVIYCPDTTELAGEIEIIDDFCPEQSGDFVEFFLDPNVFCVEYTGLDLGVDSACVVLCDEFGFCDTTFFCVVVVEYFDPPVAVDDCDTTTVGTPVVIDFQANDILYGGVEDLYLLTQPSWGTATLNLDGSVTYNPNDQYCERLDSFSYVACTPTGCDTASICVWIECVDIVIFNAVSANQDGVNDYFHIANIEEFPESRLRIYNRWGNLVYDRENYRNDWQGTYNGNNDLPDGTYFYILELNDEDSRVFKGYLELYR